MIKNKLVLMGLTGILAVSNVMPVMAAFNFTIITEDNADTSNSKTVNNGKEYKADDWIWAGGKCYYYTSGTAWHDPNDPFISATLFTNGTTPDGYTVNELGQWTVDGVVQTNNYGNEKVGTEEYSGKSDSEIWQLMRGKLEGIWSDMYPNSGSEAFKGHKDKYGDSIEGNADSGGSSYRAWCDDSAEANEEFIRVYIPSAWDNQTNQINSAQDIAFLSNASAITEKTIKTVVGDNIGQELFNYLRSVADNSLVATVCPKFNEDGSPATEYILYKEDGTAWETTKEEYEYYAVNWRVKENPTIIKARPELNGGINGEAWIATRPQTKDIITGTGLSSSKVDVSQWKNKTTDYGKRFDLSNDNGLYITIYK